MSNEIELKWTNFRVTIEVLDSYLDESEDKFDGNMDAETKYVLKGSVMSKHPDDVVTFVAERVADVVRNTDVLENAWVDMEINGGFEPSETYVEAALEVLLTRSMAG